CHGCAAPLRQPWLLGPPCTSIDRPCIRSRVADDVAATAFCRLNSGPEHQVSPSPAEVGGFQLPTVAVVAAEAPRFFAESSRRNRGNGSTFQLSRVRSDVGSEGSQRRFCSHRVWEQQPHAEHLAVLPRRRISRLKSSSLESPFEGCPARKVARPIGERDNASFWCAGLARRDCGQDARQLRGLVLVLGASSRTRCE